MKRKVIRKKGIKKSRNGNKVEKEMIERSTDSKHWIQNIQNLTSIHLKLTDFILEMQGWLIVRKSFTIM